MTNHNNIVKIGNALKWRGVFDISKKYYQENIVTLHGSVFRCKILQSQGIPPVEINEETGYMTYTNPDVWDVVIDMAYYYNYVQDQVNFNTWITEIALQLLEDVDAIKEDDNHQWEHIKKLEIQSSTNQKEIDFIYALIDKINETDNSQQQRIDELNEKVESLESRIKNLQSGVWGTSVVSSGLWRNSLPWLNEDKWSNYPSGGLSSGGSCECDHDDMANLRKTVEQLAETVEKQGKIIEYLQSKLNGKGVRVKEYHEEDKCIELEGDIEVLELTEDGTLSVSLPNSLITYNVEEKSIELN